MCISYTLFLCYTMSSAYLFYICRKNSHVRNPTVWFINRQYVSAFCRRGCVWNHPSQPGAVAKETLPLCLSLYADHRQRCFTEVFLLLFVCVCVCFLGNFCVSFGKERGGRDLLQSDFMASVVAPIRHVCVCFCCNVCVNIHAAEPAPSWTVMLHHPLSSQVEGWRGCRERRPVWKVRRPPTHDLWQFVVICA